MKNMVFVLNFNQKKQNFFPQKNIQNNKLFKSIFNTSSSLQQISENFSPLIKNAMMRVVVIF